MTEPYLIKSPHQNLLSVTTSYAHTDTEELYLENKKKFGLSWYYYDNPIEYRYNSLGYRMKEVDEVNWDNYILFLGCSYTVGIGLHLENTFPYIVSKNLNCDYVNGAIGGSSNEFALNNLIHFLNRAVRLPQAIVVTWPNLNRTMYWHICDKGQEKVIFKLPNMKNNVLLYQESYKDFLSYSHLRDIRFRYIRETTKLICRLANIQLIETALNRDISIKSMKEYDGVKFWNLGESDIHDINVNKARDIGSNGIAHPGIYANNEIAKYITTKIGTL